MRGLCLLNNWLNLNAPKLSKQIANEIVAISPTDVPMFSLPEKFMTGGPDPKMSYLSNTDRTFFETRLFYI